MGEAARRARIMMNSPKPIQAAWDLFASKVIAPTAPVLQRQEMQKAFYAGAAILFEAMMAGLDPEAEPTDADMRRMDRIAAELQAFALQAAAEIPAAGSA